tara:strand:- start:50 stop:535 length:486 start_codon:yes stop_codon:yes gene_type:complete
MKITKRQLRRIIKEEKAKVLAEQKIRRVIRRRLMEQTPPPPGADAVEWIVGVDLPGTPSMGNVDQVMHKGNTKVRKKLAKLIGFPIKLTGSGTANPNYKVEASFATEQEAQAIADQLSQEVAAAIASQELVYGSWTPKQVQQGKAGYVIDWDVAAKGNYWG